MSKSNVYRNGRVHVKAEMCATCIFRPGNLMRLEPGRVTDMVRQSKENDSAIVCHDTSGKYNAVCRGFLDKHFCGPVELADRLGILEMV